jgi:gamma-glutamyl:cysteine ligase YbdK (ATP-grasp superfamily)
VSHVAPVYKFCVAPIQGLHRRRPVWGFHVTVGVTVLRNAMKASA